MLRLHPLFEILVGGRDHAHVDLDRSLTTDAVELALRRNAQEPRLQRGPTCRRSRPERVCLRQPARSVPSQCVGAGERTFSWPNSSDSNRSAVNAAVLRRRRLCSSATVSMQGTRHELLARARFTGDEHRHAGSGQAADGANTCCMRRPDRAAPGCCAGRHPRDRYRRLLRRAADQIDRLVDVERLRQILERAALIRGDRGIQVASGVNDDDRADPAAMPECP